MDDKKSVTTMEDVAAHYKKSVRTIHRWKRRGMPVGADGAFDLEAIDSWLSVKQGLLDPVTAEETSGGETSDGGKDFWDKESKKYQARMRELEYKKRRGELIEWSKVEDEFVARVFAVKHALLALERSLPPDLVACRSEREMSAVIHKVIRGILERFARPLPENLGPPNRGNENTITAKEKAEEGSH